MKVDVLKITRLCIGSLVFLSLTSMQGMEMREVQQAMMTIACMLIFSLLLKNIWLTLFLVWTVFLYILSRFSVGATYFFNIFFGCVLYFVAKVSFKKDEHIDYFIKMVIFFACANMAYMILQSFDLDFYYYLSVTHPTGEHFTRESFRYLCGFMAFTANMGVLMALTIPLIATRRFRGALWLSLILFIPLYISKSSICIVGGLMGFLFVAFYKLKRWQWASVIVVGVLLASAYVIKVDIPMGMMGTRPKMWKVVMRDAAKHPVIGHGLDSFRHFTAKSKEKYCENIEKTSKGWHVTVWDNPHNLLITLAFEFGFLMWILLGGYLRDCLIAFRRSAKDKNTLALAGFVMVFFIVSMAQFPICLAAMAVIIIPGIAMLERKLGLYGLGT